MKKIFRFISVMFFLYNIQCLYAQQWHYYNPTAGFDINAVEIPGMGIIAIGGGWETHDSIQIMLQTNDYGVTWNENNHDGPAPWNKSIAFSDSLNGYGVGYNGRIISSDDAGRNWGNPVAPINRNFNKIIYTGNGTYYVAGGNKTHDSIQTILKSTNYGNSWNVIFDSHGPWLKSITFPNNMKGYAVGDHGVIISTTNGGNTWTPVTAPLQRDYNAITFVNADTGYIVGGTDLGLFSRFSILRTVNGGLDWSVLEDNQGGILKDISFADARVGYAVGDRATVLQTVNGGLNWLPLIIDSSLTGNECFNTVKFFNRTFGVVGGKAGVLYVYKNLPVDAFTLGSIQVGTTDATLLGEINTHTKNARYSFVYSNNINFSLSDTTQGINVQNDSLLLISEYLHGLTPNTHYYYYLKAITATDTVYGDTLSFSTGANPSFDILTNDATSVSTWQAYLNGFINKCPERINLYFEYGTSLTFGSQIVATPMSVNDTLMHNIQANITGLHANNQYFFRLKGVSDTGTYYGGTKMFFAVNLPFVNTGIATNVTQTSAQLNGQVNNDGSPTAIKFEYGLTELYGNEINGVPDSVSGTGSVIPSCIVTGLSPASIYHFRLKAINSVGTSYGADMMFYTSTQSASTLPASNIGAYTAQLNGMVNANNFPTANKFEYGITSGYGNEVTAIPDTSRGDSNVTISCPIFGLVLNTTYHYRAKTINAIGTTYGNDMTFTTSPPPTISTSMATEITLNSAKLNAIINPHHVATTIKFDYGITTSYGNEINASPASSSDSVDFNVFANLSGLLANSIYHFRIKAITSNITIYGNDIQFYTGHPEIPNFDFEIWDSISYTKPEGWNIAIGKVTQNPIACHNNYSVRIENDTINGWAPGIIIMGSSNAMSGGTPFNARPDTLIGCFNYFIPDNDTALIILMLKKQGVFISQHMFPIVGTSSGNFTDLKFPITYYSAGNADSLIIAIAVTNIHHMIPPLPVGGYLIVDDIRFHGTTENIPNNDFENWETNTYYTPNSWVFGNNTSNPENEHVSRTNDAQHGNYAVLVRNIINPPDTIRGWLSTNQNWNVPGFSVNNRYKSLTGYYKFLPQNNDTMNIQVIMYKAHNKIGYGEFRNMATVTNYEPFIVNINYNDSLVPDSCQINFSSYNRNPLGNSQLYADNLNFDGFLTGVKEPVLPAADNLYFNVYPNPFNKKATVSFKIQQDEELTIRLFDLSGKQVVLLAEGKYKAGDYKLDLSAKGLQKGFYICVIRTKRNNYIKKIIVQ